MEQEVRTLGDVELTITVEKILELAKEVAKTTVNEINELEEKKREVEADLEMALRKGRSCGMSDQEIRELFQIVLED